MSKIPEVFAIFEQKLAHVLSFTVVPLKSKDLKNALEEILTYFSSIVERASKAESRIAELSQAVGLITTMKPTMVMDANHPLDMVREVAEHVTARDALIERLVEVGNDIVEEAQLQEPDVQELRDNWRVLIAEWKAMKKESVE